MNGKRKPVPVQSEIVPKSFWRILIASFSLAEIATGLLFISGLLLTVWAIEIYRHTVISWVYPTLLWSLPGIILTPVLYNYLNRKIWTKSWLLHSVFNICTWGGIVVYCFMAGNFYSASNTTSVVQVPVINKGHLAKGRNGCGEPWLEVEYNGEIKQLIFDCGTNIDKIQLVQLTISKGFLGFDVIRNQNLVY